MANSFLICQFSSVFLWYLGVLLMARVLRWEKYFKVILIYWHGVCGGDLSLFCNKSSLVNI
jgi:hypothetical protein